MRKITLVVLIILLVFGSVIPIASQYLPLPLQNDIHSIIPPSSASSPTTTWTTTGGWINVTYTNPAATIIWKCDFRNTASGGKSIYFYMARYSNTTVYSAASLGFMWIEAKPTFETSLYSCLPANRVYYNDGNVLVVGGSDTHGAYEDWVFWADQPYFAFEGGIKVNAANPSVIEQFQIGVDTPSTGTYSISNIYPDGTQSSGAFTLGGSYGSVALTDKVLSACGCFSWQANYQTGSGDPAMGWIMVHNSMPYLSLSNGYGDSGNEMLYSEFAANAANGKYLNAQMPYSFNFSSIVYPFMSNASSTAGFMHHRTWQNLFTKIA